MPPLQIIKRLACVAAFVAPVLCSAEDIDLFQGGAAITGNKPNVLIFVDNSANWNSAAQGWPDGVKQGQSELAAMNTVVGALTGDVRVGVMMFVKGTGVQNDGGYVRYAIRDMDATNRTALQNLISGINSGSIFNDENTGQQVASANAKYGEGLYEVFKYFSGSTNYAGPADLRDYAGNGSPTLAPYTAGSVAGNALANSGATQYVSPLSSDAMCAKNYMIFIGNGFPSNSSADPTTYGDAGLTNFNSTQIYNEGNKTTYGDEWSRFLYQYGAANLPCVARACAAGETAPCQTCANGKVITYTIDVYKDHQDASETSLLKSMARVGGGKYFAATSQDEIKTALQTIFNEVQAVNSVFTSASLPVSVNTQGTYLNQIYMGVFRPDGSGSPRWMGNLKQYQFGLTTDATGARQIFLADATGAAAVNTQTGFVSPNAQSFWTTAVSPACSTDASLGFWCYSPSGVGADKDLPDGDLVEKGAAAQKLRTQGSAGRTMYTCTPACTSGAAPSSWSTSNAALVTALSSASANITSLTRSGPTVSVTTATDLGLSSPTDNVTISGSSVGAYNTLWTATKVDATHFTFTLSETPATPATGSAITAAAGAAVSQAVTSGSAMTMDAAHLVTVNLTSHGFVTGQSVTIAGADVSAGMAAATTPCTANPGTCEYNGIFSITKIDANNFSYTPPTANFGSNTASTTPPATFVAALGTAQLTCINKTSPSVAYTTYSGIPITAMTRTSGTGAQTVDLTLTMSSGSQPDCFGTGAGPSLAVGAAKNNIVANSLVISGSNAANSIDGSYTLTSAGTSCNASPASSNTHACFGVTVTGGATTTIAPASPATGTITATGLPTRSVTSITRTAGNTATVTVTTATDHGFSNGNSVTIAGADQTEYNGTFTIAGTTATTFTYTITTGPATSATGGTVAKGSSVDASTLINWVRGIDNKDDENANGDLTDVRTSIHGDVLHSRPVVINYGGETGIYAFYGANDGALHAVKGGQAVTDGSEAWSFVAPEHYSKLGRLYLNSPLIKYPSTGVLNPTPTKRDYYFDGNLGVYQSADLATTHIFVSMRRGGRSVYAFDVSDPTAPTFLWKKSDTDAGFSELGQTWSEPKVLPIRKTAGVACNPSDASTYTRALVFGAGYDATEEDKDAGTVRSPTMGRGVFVLDATDGSLVKQIDLPNSAVAGITNSTKRYSVPSEIQVLDTNGDGCFDRLYAGDTGANLFRVDIDDADPDNWKSYKLAALGDIGNDGGSDDRKFLYPPDAVLGFLSGAQVVYLLAGTGDREQPRSNTIIDKFFMIKDTIVAGTDPATVVPVKLSDLPAVPDTSFDAGTVLDPTLASVKGWYIDFETGEKAVNAPLTVGGITFFGTNRPMTAAEVAAQNSCTPDLGVAHGYAINFLTGTAAYSRGLYTNFVGGGLPPSPVSGVVQITTDNGTETERFVIGSGGTDDEGSAIEGVKTQASPSSRRTRAFWYFRKDD